MWRRSSCCTNPPRSRRTGIRNRRPTHPQSNIRGFADRGPAVARTADPTDSGGSRPAIAKRTQRTQRERRFLRFIALFCDQLAWRKFDGVRPTGTDFPIISHGFKAAWIDQPSIPGCFESRGKSAPLRRSSLCRRSKSSCAPGARRRSYFSLLAALGG